APSLSGSRDTTLGYDRSDHFVNVRTTTLTDANGVTAAPNIARDFNFANKVYAQAGLSVIEIAHRNYSSGTTPPANSPTFTFPLSMTERMNIASRLNDSSVPVNKIETYYAPV